jgi:hypothetical protein
MSSNLVPVVEAINVKKTYLLGKVPVEALRGVNLRSGSWRLRFHSWSFKAAANPLCSTSLVPLTNQLEVICLSTGVDIGNSAIINSPRFVYESVLSFQFFN